MFWRRKGIDFPLIDEVSSLLTHFPDPTLWVGVVVVLLKRAVEFLFLWRLFFFQLINWSFIALLHFRTLFDLTEFSFTFSFKKGESHLFSLKIKHLVRHCAMRIKIIYMSQKIPFVDSFKLDHCCFSGAISNAIQLSWSKSVS